MGYRSFVELTFNERGMEELMKVREELSEKDRKIFDETLKYGHPQTENGMTTFQWDEIKWYNMEVTGADFLSNEYKDIWAIEEAMRRAGESNYSFYREGEGELVENENGEEEEIEDIEAHGSLQRFGPRM